MKKTIIGKDLINKITHRVSVRERALFTIMRQSGLSPQTIKKLRISSLEPTTTIPRKIDVKPELTKSPIREPPIFIGEEANIYINQYLATRNNAPPESLLFTTYDDPKKEISTKNVSRAFRQTLEKIKKEERNRYGMSSADTAEFDKKNFSLISLVEFYRENTKHYQKELDKNPNENDEYYRKLYKDKAMPFLETESKTTITIDLTKRQYQNKIEKQDNQIKEMRQTIAKDSEYITSILTLLYNNEGDPETGENEEIGNNFIELWKETAAKQTKNMLDSWGKIENYIPYVDIIEELTKTLKRIKKPYDRLERQTTQ